MDRTWMKPCGLQIVEYFKCDHWEIPRCIITENVDELHDRIAENAKLVAKFLEISGFHLVDVNRLTQDQVVDLWRCGRNNLDHAIKLLNHIQCKKNSATAKYMFMDASCHVMLYMIKTNLVTDRGFIARYTNISTVANFRRFGPYVYTKKTYMNYIPSSLSLCDRDDLIWLIHNLKRDTIMTSNSVGRCGVSVETGVIYFCHISQIISDDVKHPHRLYDATAIDASLYYMQLNDMI